MAEHTPTPWFDIKIPGRGPKIYHGQENGQAVCQLFDRVGNAFLDAEANASFIVKAVNNHDALVKALTDLLNDKATTYGVRVMRAREVLAGVVGTGREGS